MSPVVNRLRSIKTLPQLIAYLRDELDWPIDSGDVEEVTFDYTAAELGLEGEAYVGIKEIKQLRPLERNQPWGIFFVNFEKKRLPVVVMRKILAALVVKKRTSGAKADRQAWQPHDLLFISAYGEEDKREITFAHFVAQESSNLAELRVLGWDDDDTPLHMDYVAGMLREKLRWEPALARTPDEWRQRWSDAFLIRHRHVITTSKELAEELARLAKRLRSRIRTILRAERETGEIRKLQQAFKATLIHDLDDDAFADMFAQAVTYGLFSVSVRRTVPGMGTAVVKDDVPNLIFTSPFLKETLGVFLGIKTRQGGIDFDSLGVSDVTDVLTSPDTHMEVVLADFNNRTQREDPVIHFYETFLAAYNKEQKIRRGVFYTPQPVVSYIVRSVHELLQTEFGLEDGLASTITWGEMLQRSKPQMAQIGADAKAPENMRSSAKSADFLRLPSLTDEPGETRTIDPKEPFVQILDPATGTATFLVEVIDVIHRHLRAKWDKGGLAAMPAIANPPKGAPAPRSFEDYWNVYVPKALLPRLHGYELMMAPYAIAHMKLGLKLAETRYRFTTEEPAQIYLTNALEPWVKQLPLIGFDALAHEAAAVNEVKRHKRFTVVIGNPPYAGNSANASVDENGQLTFIGRLIQDYKTLNGEPVEERQIKWLQDDYVKFIRIAQQIVGTTETGILGFITNHSYLDNPTFRGMRWNLQRDFPKLALLDLHGNQKKKERCPDGSEDQNVFDIIQGVGLLIAVRMGGSGASAPRIQHADVWGTRTEKYRTLSQSLVSSTRWTSLSPVPPFFLFICQNVNRRAEYDEAWSITEAALENNVGFVTARDAFAIAFDDDELRERFSRFRSTATSNAQVVQEFGLKDTTSWSLNEARRAVRADRHWEKNFVPCTYRPFDPRRIYYSRDVLERPVYQIHRHLLAGPNLGITVGRAGQVIDQGTWNIVYATRFITEFNLFRRGGNNLFPLYLYEDSVTPQKTLGMEDVKRPNLSPTFLHALANRLNLTRERRHGLPAGLTPEDIFHYIYAVFHSPGYRSRYAEFLKIDFPRLPLPGNLELFRALAKRGGELVALHLLESPKLQQPISEFAGPRNPEVEKVTWSKNTVWIDKEQTIGFRGVRQSVWNFHIGGYQVCEKWLKDRKGRTLSKDAIAHYHKIVVALTETIRLMAEIDKVIEKHGGWPGAFATANAPSEAAAVAHPSAVRSKALGADLGLRVEDELPLK